MAAVAIPCVDLVDDPSRLRTPVRAARAPSALRTVSQRKQPTGVALADRNLKLVVATQARGHLLS